MASDAHVFLGALPPQGLIPAWKMMQGIDKPPLRWSLPSKLHLTLLFWPALDRGQSFELAKELSDKVKQAISSLHGSCESHTSGYGTFPGTRILYLAEESASVRSLRNALYTRSGDLPLRLQPEARDEFIPHWTVARGFSEASESKFPGWYSSLKHFRYSGVIREVALFRSRNGRYEWLESWQLVTPRMPDLSPPGNPVRPLPESE